MSFAQAHVCRMGARCCPELLKRLQQMRAPVPDFIVGSQQIAVRSRIRMADNHFANLLTGLRVGVSVADLVEGKSAVVHEGA